MNFQQTRSLVQGALVPFDRKAPRQERTISTAWEAPGRQERQLARHQGGRKGSIGQPARHQQGGTTKARKNHLDSLGGTRETCSAGLPIESRFWKGAGFCLIFNTTSMANGPVRGKSWGGLHGRLPSTDWPLRHQGGRKGSIGRGTREAGKNHLDNL